MLHGPGSPLTLSGDRLCLWLGLSRLNACRDRKGQAGQISEWASLGLGPVPMSESELAPLS